MEEIQTLFWSGNLKGIDRLEDLGLADRMLLEWILENWVQKMWVGFICLWIGTSDRLL